MKGFTKLVFGVVLLLIGANLAHAKGLESVGKPMRPKLSAASRAPSLVAAAVAPDVFRCKTAAEWDALTCTTALPSPFDSSAFDRGIGALFPVNGVVSVYTLRFTAPAGASVYNINATKRSATDSYCANGYVINDGSGPSCYYGETGYLIYVTRRVGQWKIELLADNVLQWTAYSNAREAQIRKKSGDGQSAPLGEALRTKPQIALYHFDNTLVDVAESSSGVNTDIVAFTITGPSKATGMYASSPTYLWHATSAELDVRVGNKVGTYTAKGAITGASMPSPFTFTAVGRLIAPDHPETEEDNGEKCCHEYVGDPVTLGLGNSFQQEADYPRTGLSILEFTRSYNGQGSNSRIMGNYWSTTYDRWVVLPTAPGQPAKVRRPDGKAISFYDVGGVYQPHAYFEGTLIKTGSGWTYTEEDKSVENYDITGRLLSVTDRVGRSVAITYDSAGNLSKATANTGESLTLAYNTNKQLSTLTDNAGHVWTYYYNGYSDLVSVLRPFGYNKNYYYDDPNNPFLLTSTWEGVSGAGDGHDTQGGSEVHWQYDTQSRVTSNFVRDGINKVDIAYLPDGSRTVTDSLGRTTTYQTRLVNGRGFVTAAVGPGFASFGLADGQFEYDADMNITARTQFGRRMEFGNFDTKGQNGYVIEAAGTAAAKRTDFTYDARFIGKPTRITSPSVAPGHVRAVDLVYDATGNVTSQAVSGFRPDGTAISRTTTYQYAGPYGQLTQVDGPRTDVADLARFEYGATTKRLLRVTDPDGLVVRNNLAYNASGQLVSEDRANGLKLTYTYIAGTNLISTLTEVQGASTRKTTWTYTARREISSVTYHDGVGTDFVVAFYYDAAGNIRTIMNPPPGATEGGPAVTFARDTEGNPVQDLKLGPYAETFSVTRTFDAYSRVDKLINFTGTTDYDYHPDGTLTRVRDGKQQVTSYEYDDFKRMTRAIQPGQIVTTLGYDVQDHLVQVTDPNLAVTTYVFDDLGNHLRTQSPDTGITSATFDTAGNVTQSIDAKGQVATRTYSAGNRLLTVDRPGIAEDETYTYDSCQNGIGLLCRVGSGNGEYVAYEYDGFGRPAKVTTKNGTLAYTYDANDSVTGITYPSGRRVNYLRNSAGQVTSVTVVDGLRTYNLAANIEYMTMGPAKSWTYGNGLTEVRQFNEQYLPTSLGVAGKFTATYPGYDANANITQMVVNGQSQNYDYDALDRLKSASGAFGLRSYTYDPVGNRRSMTADGIVTDSTYEAQSNRLASDSNWTYARDAIGNTTGKLDSASLGVAFDYNVQNQLENVSAASSPVGSTATYLYNALGQRSFKSLNGDNRRFVYGTDGKLLSESLVDGTIVEEYVYLNGQPLALLGTPPAPVTPPVIDAIVDDVAAGSPWAVKSSQSAFGGKYQAMTVASPYTDSYTWGWTASVPGYYDVWVWWMRRPTDGTTTYYTLDGGYALASVTHASQVQGAWTYLGRYHLTSARTALALEEWRHTPDTGSPSGGSLTVDAAHFKLIAQDTGLEGHFNYVLNDHLGTPRAVTDWTGKIIWSATYDPFGAATVNADPDGNGQSFTMNLRFPGQYFDAETGLHYNYFRDYDPATGRYIESDPIGLVGGMNTYAYLRGNPLGGIDPFGLEAELILFYPGSSKFYRGAKNFQSPSAVFTVAGHGNNRYVWDLNDRNLDVDRLYDLIFNDKDFPGKEAVLLISCQTGKGRESIAQQLADRLGVPVVAPDEYVFFREDGSFYLAKGRSIPGAIVPIPGTTGNWVTFRPRG